MMQVVPVPTLTCPHDGSPLTLAGNSLVCANRHTFDRAREGYVNLLPVQDKASADPGDSKEMVTARQRFLATGSYAPIAAAVGDAVLEAIGRRARRGPFSILDAGCGEGYYLQQLAARLEQQPGAETVALAGIDISKWAVRAAAKRTVPVAWAVASNKRPPLPDASCDLILCLFGFAVWDGFARVQAEGGEVLLVDPGPDHLLELRAIIYDDVRRKERGPPGQTPHYRLADEQRVRAPIMVGSPAAIADLLSMTPHAHRGSAEGKAKLATLATLETTIDVTVRRFIRER